MRDDLANALRLLGSSHDPSKTRAHFEPLLSDQARDDVLLQADMGYGPHVRHRVDVFAPTGTGAHPVLIWFHGGGFIRGDKALRSNIGWWGARQGFVTLIPNYRLAPEARWPSGPQDVALLWEWITTQCARFAADPDRIVLAGESAGAAHVAAASLTRRFQPPGWRIRGAALFSGPYDARLEGSARTQFGVPTPDPRNEAYFGSDPEVWSEASIVDHADASPFPLSIVFSQRDLLQMQVQASTLFARLVKDLGFAPELHALPEHNHFSPGYSIGTEERGVSTLLSDFVQRACT